MNIEFRIELGGISYSCALKKQTHCYSLSCDDQNNNQVAYSTNVDEDAARVIKMLLMSMEEEVEGTDFEFILDEN